MLDTLEELSIVDNPICLSSSTVRRHKADMEKEAELSLAIAKEAARRRKRKETAAKAAARKAAAVRKEEERELKRAERIRRAAEAKEAAAVAAVAATHATAGEAAGLSTSMEGQAHLEAGAAGGTGGSLALSLDARTFQTGVASANDAVVGGLALSGLERMSSSPSSPRRFGGAYPGSPAASPRPVQELSADQKRELHEREAAAERARAAAAERAMTSVYMKENAGAASPRGAASPSWGT